MENPPFESQTSYACPTIGISYLRKVAPHIFVGAKMYNEGYSFRFDRVNLTNLFNLFGGSDSTYATQIRFKATYVFVGPIIDVGIGRHQYLHFYIMPAAGFMVQGSQTLRIYQLVGSTTLNDATWNTTNSIKHEVFRFNAGMVQPIRLSNNWHITINESIGSVTSLSDEKGTNGVPLKPNYYSLQIGLMRRYSNKG